VDFVKEPSREIPVMRKVDVVVVGGGPGGFGAAIAAARNGAETLLVERYGFLGGMVTGGLVIWIPIYKTMPMETYGETRAIQGGVIAELVERLVEIGGAIAPSAAVGDNRTVISTDPEIDKVVLIEMLEEARAEILLHALVVGVMKDGKRVKGVIIESKSGRQAILADIVVDASGDGDVAAFAGAEYEKADNPLMMTLQGFLGNVDPEKAAELRRGNRGKFNKLVDEAIKRGELTISEKRVLPEAPPSKVSPLGVLDPKKTPANWYRLGEAGGYMETVSGDCTNVLDLTKAELTTRKTLLPILNFFRKYVPGYEKAYLSYTATQIGVRESRRVLGDYVLTADKDIKEGLRHEDVIAKARFELLGGGWSAYTPERAPVFDIPYRCIVPKVIDNLLVAGRCISMDHKAAINGSLRTIDTCICVGQAAGTAAALSVRSKVRPRELPIAVLQQTLKAQGASLG